MRHSFCLLFLAAAANAMAQQYIRGPVYNYRYETQDLMDGQETQVPIHGYHVVQGSYYPPGGYMGGPMMGQMGYGPMGGFGMGGGGMGGGGMGIGGGIGGGGLIAPVAYGGEVIDKNAYSGEKKNLNDASFEKAHGSKGEEFKKGQEGYSQGKVGVKDVKGDSGYYNDEAGGKKLYEDGKAYHGAQKFNQEGKTSGEHKEQKGHKKGHVIKGFKSSHHKDESGKTEEFYDEENDEGALKKFNAEGGSFGENAGSVYKGGHEDGKFNKGEHKKEGHYDNEHYVNNNNAGQGQYGEKAYGGHGTVYGINNGVDKHSLLGHQESSKFYKHHPYHAPFGYRK